MRNPRGVIEDVLVKVDQFLFPADFIVLDTELGQTSKQTTPIILGRPFLATANANIHVRAGVMDVSFGNMNVKLNIYNSSRHAQSEEDCFAVNVLDSLVEDPLQACLDHFGFEEFDIDKSIEEVNTLLDSTHLMDISLWVNQVEPTPSLMGAPVISSVGILLQSDLEPLPLESIVSCVDLVDTVMINQGDVDYIQSREVGGTGIEDEDHCTNGWKEAKVCCSVLVPRVSFETFPFKDTFPWYDDFICVVTSEIILTHLCHQLFFLTVVESLDFFWDDPTRVNFKKRIKYVF